MQSKKVYTFTSASPACVAISITASHSNNSNDSSLRTMSARKCSTRSDKMDNSNWFWCCCKESSSFWSEGGSKKERLLLEEVSFEPLVLEKVGEVNETAVLRRFCTCWSTSCVFSSLFGWQSCKFLHSTAFKSHRTA